jgi:alanine dehydrogenase
VTALIGASLLQSDHGGRGILLGGVMGVPPGTVVVLGTGTVGTNAVRVAVGLGARVVAIDRRASALEAIDRAFGGAVETRVSTPEVVAGAVAEADLVVGAVLVPGARAPMVVTREMVRSMVEGSVIVDVAVDQGGCVATTRPTSHETPTYVDEGVIHYAVPNIPALVPRTATLALTSATLPYVQALVSTGTRAALASDPALTHGLTVWDDRVVCAPTAAALGVPATDPVAMLSLPSFLKMSA